MKAGRENRKVELHRFDIRQKPLATKGHENKARNKTAHFVSCSFVAKILTPGDFISLAACQTSRARERRGETE